MISVNPSTFSVPVAPINGSFTTTPRIIISMIYVTSRSDRV